MRLQFIPNLICIGRIILVGPIIFALFSGRFDAAVVMFVIAGLSDGLDGFLARRFDWRSRLGSVLDPLADKLLMISVFLTLTLAGLIPAWLAVAVVARDLVILAGSLAYNFLIGPLQGEPSRVSKINTFLQLLYVFAVMLSAAGLAIPQPPVQALAVAILVTVIISGVDYTWSWGHRAMRERRGKQS